MVDARGVRHLLEKPLGLAETSGPTGEKSAQVMLRETGLSPEAKARLRPFYLNEAHRRSLGHVELGLAICKVLREEAADEEAAAQVDGFERALRELGVSGRAALEALEAEGQL